MKSKKRNLKYWIVKLHLWLGLGSGLVVFIVSITGCLFVFEKEINGLAYKSIFTVPRQTAKVPLSAMLHTAQNVLGEKKKIYAVTAYKEEGRAWEFMTYKANDTAATYFGAVEHYESVFINPHTGVVTGRVNYKYNFFSMVDYLDHVYEYYCSGQFFKNVYQHDGETVFKQAQAGDARALRLYAEMGTHLGNAIKMIMYTYDPSLIIFGGSVRFAYPYFQEAMWQRINSFAFTKSISRLRIELSELESGGILGAAALYYDSLS